MPWQIFPQMTKEEIARVEAEFGRKARFLVDENLEGDTIELLKRLGWNTKGISELGLSGHEDEEVFAAAWREDRLLITNDRDFLNDSRFPEHRNPGIIVLPDAKFGSDSFVTSLRVALNIIGPFREAYRKSKIIISRDGEITIINRNATTGLIESNRYRLGKHDETYQWVDSETVK